MEFDEARYPSGRFFLFLLAMGGVVGLILLVLRTPFWTFYAAPLTIAPFLIWELTALGRDGSPTSPRRILKRFRGFWTGSAVNAMPVSIATMDAPELSRAGGLEGNVSLEASVKVVAAGGVLAVAAGIIGIFGATTVSLLSIGAVVFCLFALRYLWGLDLALRLDRDRASAVLAYEAATRRLVATAHEVEPVLSELRQSIARSGGSADVAFVSVIPADRCWVLAYESGDDSGVGTAFTIEEALIAGRAFLQERGDGEILIFNKRREIEDHLPVAYLLRGGNEFLVQYAHRHGQRIDALREAEASRFRAKYQPEESD